jgi:hypothetical protein
MASFTLQTRGLVPEGTTLTVFGDTNVGHHKRKGSGTAGASATVTGGQAAFTGLNSNQPYAAVSDSGHLIRFRTAD